MAVGLFFSFSFLFPLPGAERTARATVASVMDSPHGFAYAVNNIAKRCGEHNTYYDILGSHLFFTFS